MKKIMFSDALGLTRAVLEGRKTMTRRIIKAPKKMEGKDVYGFAVVRKPGSNEVIEVFATDADRAQINNILPTYKVGELVAVAQSYKDAGIAPDVHIECKGRYIKSPRTPGWTNKMFVSADYMKHFIRITNVRVERLQDISEEDCLREGIREKSSFPHKKSLPFYFDGGKHSWDNSFSTPREAFAALIDKVSGKGTWDSNPFCFVYEFELVK